MSNGHLEQGLSQHRWNGGVVKPAGEPARYADWDAVYLDNCGRVYRFILSKVGNAADAEDLTAEVFVAAVRLLRTTSSVGEVRAYLNATARSVVIEHWKRRFNRELRTVDVDEALAVSTEVSAQSNGRSDAQVARLLDQLPDRYRRFLTLRFLQSYSLNEVAAEMGVSVGHARVLQHRALSRAARCLA